MTTATPFAADGLALRACRLFETTDLDDAQERISRIMQPHRLRRHATGGTSRSHMDFLRLHGVGLGTIAFGQSRIDVPPLDGYHLVVFCLTGSALLRAGNEEMAVDARHAMLCPADRPLSGQFSPDCEQFVVRIDRARLARLDGHPSPRLPPRMDLRNPRLFPWLATLRNLVSDPAAVRLVRDDPRVAADYEQLLLRLLLSGHADAPAPRHPRVRPASVHRAATFIEANASAPIGLAEIAAAAGVPERTLHDAYLRFEGVSPIRHLRNLRLDRARADLLAAGPEGSVTAIALAAGFAHLGRFAQSYMARFGERPSTTLRSSRATP